MRSAKQRAVYTNFKVISLTRLGTKLESTAPEADALTTGPSELLIYVIRCPKIASFLGIPKPFEEFDDIALLLSATKHLSLKEK